MGDVDAALGFWSQLGSLDTWAKLGEAVALLVFAWVLIDNRSRARRDEIVEWQKVVVYQIISKLGRVNERRISELYRDVTVVR